MNSKVVIFINHEWLPHAGDFDTIVFRYNIVDAKYFETTTEKRFTYQHLLSIRLSRTAMHMLKLDVGNSALDNLLYQIARNHLAIKVKHGSLLADETLHLSSADLEMFQVLEERDMEFGVPIELPIEKQIGF